MVELRWAAPATPRSRASLGLALRLGLRDTYDYLGVLMLLSFAWTMLAFTGIVGGQAIGLTLFGALPPTLAMMRFTRLPSAL